MLSYEDAVAALSWQGAVDALWQGHLRPRAESGDLLLGPADACILNRAAAVKGLGFAIKAETVFEGNGAKRLPSIQGAVLLFDATTGSVRAIIDSRLVTQFKTVGDSLLGATLLARDNCRHLVIVGAGVVAANLAQGYAAVFPTLERISIWSRRPEQAQALAARLSDLPVPVAAVADLRQAVGAADIVSAATMSKAPLILGDWVGPGTHVDLIGAYTPRMRESDDALIARARVFVDCIETTVDRIGDLMAPVASGAVTRDHVLGDLYSLVPLGKSARTGPDEITVYKNGGGAHLDLMIAAYVADANSVA